jgi:uncharacterized protein YdeI (YjbR/CyaY-like superfamily)
VDLKKNAELIIPEEFQNKLDEIPGSKTGIVKTTQEATTSSYSGDMNPHSPYC